jgi:tetratricopeptide (TPR) repeat protein
VKRTLAALVLLALAGGAAAAYLATAREQQYRLLLRRGDAALRGGATFGALEAYSGAIALRPDSMLAHLRRGQTFRRRGDLDAATRDLRTASSLDPSAPQPLESLGDVFFARGWYEQAAETYEVRLRLDDSAPSVTYRLALARYRSGDLDAALAATAQTTRLADTMSEAHYLAGLCLREQGRWREAAEAFERTLALSPGFIAAREELADVYDVLGRRGDQLEQLQVIAGMDRSNVERQVAVGLAHARAGQSELAVLTLGSALERTPDQPQIYGAIGRVWLDLAIRRPEDRPDALGKALEALGRAAASSGATSETLALYARALERDNRSEAAEQVLQQAIRRTPVAPSALLDYAGVAERQGHPDAARAALVEYTALVGETPDFASQAARIGRLSVRVNDLPSAIQWLERAVAAAPDDLGYLVSLADAQLNAGNVSAARSTIERALEKDPANHQVLALARRAS